MTVDLKAIRERAVWTLQFSEDGAIALSHARDVKTLLDLIEKPDEKAVERAVRVYERDAEATEYLKGCMRAALRAAYTED